MVERRSVAAVTGVRFSSGTLYRIVHLGYNLNNMRHIGIVNLPVTFLKEGKRFVAYTPALDLSTSGKTYDEVKKRFDEIVNIFIEELVKNNTLDQVLKDMGWREVQKKWQPPVVVSHQTQTVKVAV